MENLVQGLGGGQGRSRSCGGSLAQEAGGGLGLDQGCGGGKEGGKAESGTRRGRTGTG